MTLLSVEALTVRRGGRTVLHEVSFAVAAGEVVGLLGPNGSGKTTLLRAALGLLPATGFSSLAALGPGRRARQAAWLPQTREIAWPVSVEAVVGLGRLPHRRRGPAIGADDPAIRRALERTDLAALAHGPATELSGGEQARVLIARALAQETPLLIADEPVAGLDPAHRLRTMATFAELAAEGRGVLVSLHDLPLAARACSRLLLLHQGLLVADGPPGTVLAPERMAEVFGIRGGLRDGSFSVDGLA